VVVVGAVNSGIEETGWRTKGNNGLVCCGSGWWVGLRREGEETLFLGTRSPGDGWSPTAGLLHYRLDRSLPSRGQRAVLCVLA